MGQGKVRVKSPKYSELDIGGRWTWINRMNGESWSILIHPNCAKNFMSDIHRKLFHFCLLGSVERIESKSGKLLNKYKWYSFCAESFWYVNVKLIVIVALHMFYSAFVLIQESRSCPLCWCTSYVMHSGFSLVSWSWPSLVRKCWYFIQILRPKFFVV